MRRGTGAAVGALAMAATVGLLTAGTATADSQGGRVGKAGHVVDLGRPVAVGHLVPSGRHGRGVGAPDDWKHGVRQHGDRQHGVRQRVDRKISAPSTATHNWGGGNWNSTVIFGDMKLD
ncbi:hypothetical protein [Streptomyces rimosus]|uniref:hypothetical protein n=1 Tax=Streptomyces rimosus TaxID=1927 RepID=UPI00131ECC34|nr:hypothetical protein [Streptomyces rimosus]